MADTVEKRTGRCWLKHVHVAENGYWIWTGSLNFDPVNPEPVFMFGVIPESKLYAAGQDVKVEFAWVSDEASMGVVRWRVDMLGRATGEAWDVAFPDTAGIGSASIDSPRMGANALHVPTAALVAPALAPGNDFILKLQRDATHANDTYPVDADLVRVRMYAARLKGLLGVS